MLIILGFAVTLIKMVLTSFVKLGYGESLIDGRDIKCTNQFTKYWH